MKWLRELALFRWANYGDRLDTALVLLGGSRERSDPSHFLLSGSGTARLVLRVSKHRALIIRRVPRWSDQRRKSWLVWVTWLHARTVWFPVDAPFIGRAEMEGLPFQTEHRVLVHHGLDPNLHRLHMAWDKDGWYVQRLFWPQEEVVA